MFNYDRVTWETGDASGGVNGYGGTSAGAGFSAGDGNDDHFVELPGSRVNGAFIDPRIDGSANPDGLVHQSRNSQTPGRFVFPIRNGGAGLSASVHGRVTDAAGNGIADAQVQLSATTGSERCVYTGHTASDGSYTASGLAGGDYTLRVFGPSGTTFDTVTVLVAGLGDGDDREVDATLTSPTPPLPGTTITQIGSAGGIPTVYWNATLTLTAAGCANGSATYTIILEDGTAPAPGQWPRPRPVRATTRRRSRHCSRRTAPPT